ncbi:ACT domain-containing protein [Phyllosticta citribraziliensis]|uniref:ACT domain-containing protein n=1 Tax=Phyllosticta citribraziliensis TaxID=989973 RepID=A0ABR1MCB8_9PEZI
MEASMTLLSAHIQFLDTQLALIHIPLHLYSNFLQPILRLLLPASRPSSAGSNGSARPRKSWAYEHPFTNISITPVECSIACSRELAEDLFTSVRDHLDPENRDQVSITHEDYIVMQVDGEGLDAGQRVLELTSPLAMAGISIFFITTYFSDYILVPLRAREQVVKALEDRGFAFEDTTSSYVNPTAAATASSHNRSSASSFDLPSTPGTPPPTSINELETRTFALLKRRNVVFAVDPSIRLVQCAGSKETSTGGGETTAAPRPEDLLHLGLVKSLITAPHPTFLSLTLTDTEPASVLLEKRLLHNFAPAVLLGSKEDVLVPITLDLRDLPLESTGIVCGVAGRLVGGTTSSSLRAYLLPDAVEMSYLSTARAGTVMVAEAELGRAMEALRGGGTDGSDGGLPDNGFI